MQTKKVLKNLRPPLRTASPLTFWISVGFVWVNILIWYLLSHVATTGIKDNPVPIVNEFFPTYGHWADLFLLLGLLLAYALAANNWKWVKRMLVVGLLFKLSWTYALAYMIYQGSPVYATLFLWMFLAWTQAWCIVYFSPTVELKTNALSAAKEGPTV